MCWWKSPDFIILAYLHTAKQVTTSNPCPQLPDLMEQVGSMYSLADRRDLDILNKVSTLTHPISVLLIVTALSWLSFSWIMDKPWCMLWLKISNILFQTLLLPIPLLHPQPLGHNTSPGVHQVNPLLISFMWITLSLQRTVLALSSLWMCFWALHHPQIPNNMLTTLPGPFTMSYNILFDRSYYLMCFSSNSLGFLGKYGYFIAISLMDSLFGQYLPPLYLHKLLLLLHPPLHQH